MACSRCSSSSCTGCSGVVPYYSLTPVCEEDNCEKIYVDQFSFALCPTNSWNVPLCGQTSILKIQGVQGVSIGSYLWHTQYGYFEVTSVNTDTGEVGITNNCTTGNASVGTQIPACTCFVVTAAPADAADPSDLFPYVAIDFTAPAVSDCIDITVTTINGLTVGDIISIGTGFYSIASFTNSTVMNICNDGEGILAGTAVIATDVAGNYVYPISVVSSCCADLTPRMAAAEADIVTNTADIATNTTNIATNTASIVTNTTNIATINSTLASTYSAALDRSVTTVTVASSAAATTVYSYSVGANVLTSGRMLVLTLLGQGGNTTGVPQDVLFDVYFGGVLIMSTPPGQSITTATNRQFVLTVRLMGTGAATQVGSLVVDASNDAADTGQAPFVEQATPTANSAIANILRVDVTLSASSASLSFIKRCAILEYK
jgi:hypothetical protein